MWNKALRCDMVYDEYVLNDTCIEGCSESIRLSMHPYRGLKWNDTVHDPVHHVIFITNSQSGSRNINALNYNYKTDDRRVNSGRSGSNVKNLNSDSTTIKLSRRNAKSPRS